ncbi:MAG: hypothetical protein WCR56_04715 [Bacilli bacterium]|jgi:membrane protein YdbS with pleckstrin-like domain
MKKKGNPEHSAFPMKKCLIASLVIFICGVLVLTLLYAIVNSSSIPDKSWIFAVVWASLVVGSLIAYWIYQIIKYRKTRKDEN